MESQESSPHYEGCYSQQINDNTAPSTMNRHIPAIIAAGVGIMSGFYIWEPMFKKYQRESKGTWQYEVVQQTRAEEMNRHAEAAVASASASTPTAEPSGSTTPASPTAVAASENRDLKPNTV